jgi:hypothetical protein
LQDYCAGGCVFDHVWFGGDKELKAERNLVSVFFLFLDFGVYIKKYVVSCRYKRVAFSL